MFKDGARLRNRSRIDVNFKTFFFREQRIDEFVNKHRIQHLLSGIHEAFGELILQIILLFTVLTSKPYPDEHKKH